MDRLSMTRPTCPVAFTFRHACVIVQAPSIAKVERITP
jgi:hypothetical protein